GVGRLGPRSSWSSFDAFDSGQLQVLYAEDNIINVELVRQVLRLRPQWHLEIAHSGAQAIEMASAYPPDLLLLDMHLGDMNACAVSDSCRSPTAVPRTSRWPVHIRPTASCATCTRTTCTAATPPTPWQKTPCPPTSRGWACRPMPCPTKSAPPANAALSTTSP